MNIYRHILDRASSISVPSSYHSVYTGTQLKDTFNQHYGCLITLEWGMEAFSSEGSRCSGLMVTSYGQVHAAHLVFINYKHKIISR